MTIEAIFFDLDETLLAFDDASYERVVAQVCDGICARHPAIDARTLEAAYLPINAGRWDSSATGPPIVRPSRSGLEIWREVWRQALVACGCDDDNVVDATTELYTTIRRASYCLYDDVSAALDFVRARYRLAIISNGPADTQLDKLQRTGLDAYFDLVVTSGEFGSAKPDPSIFHHALSRLDLSAEGTWHVGDNVISDIGGAIDAGLTSVWINRHGKQRDASHPTPHHEIASLSELPALLK
jgi:HAD superfamily hydrolase (TIGR01509 family)